MSRSEQFIPDHVRAQLLALGIPTARHVADALAGLFPRELNIRAANLSTEDLARVLVDLTARGLISLSAAGVGSSIKKVEPGWHFCQLYRDHGQLLSMLVPYVREGLENGEGCLWVLPEALPISAARDALAGAIEGVDDYLASGQLEMLSHPAWYLDASRRLKSFEQISEALLGRQDRVLTKGFKFLRAAGDAGWISGTEQSKDFIEYETKVNAALGATKVAAICTYRAEVTADELVAIVTAHQDAVRAGPAS